MINKLLPLMALCFVPIWASNGQSTINTSASMTSDALSINARAATASVFRIECMETRYGGTGFLHKSGYVLTAAHVVAGCTHPVIILPNGMASNSVVGRADPDLDIAILVPDKKIPGTAIPMSRSTTTLGSVISFWGFPAGYDGTQPLLGGGYVSGTQDFTAPSGKTITEWVLNAAINHGNSGGPVLRVDTGEVIGIVVSKSAPLSKTALDALRALKSAKGGNKYTHTLEDGSTEEVSEGQVNSVVLEELRQQVQLVIGYMIPFGSINEYLISNGIDP